MDQQSNTACQATTLLTDKVSDFIKLWISDIGFKELSCSFSLNKGLIHG